MQAYHKIDLYNKNVQLRAVEARLSNCISKKSLEDVFKAYPCKLYTPNYFIRIALGLLTIVSVLFSGLLLFLLFSSATGTGAITSILIILAVTCYGTLEILVKTRHYYNAGIDNILTVLVIVFLVSCCMISARDPSYILISGVTMVIATWFCIRFTDAFMGIVAYCGFFMFAFLLCLKAGSIAQATAPFIMMLVSAIVYYVMKSMVNHGKSMYRYCYRMISFSSLVSLYAAGNYYVVDIAGNFLAHYAVAFDEPVPYGWLFWFFTISIPPAYIIFGLIKKDLVVVRTGLGLVVATFLTIKHYYSILPPEIEMLAAGAILIIACYVVSRHLSISKYGYTLAKRYVGAEDILNAEGLIVAETVQEQHPADTSGLFAGGSGGGGGATGDF